MKINANTEVLLSDGIVIRLSDLINSYIATLPPRNLTDEEKLLFDLRDRREKECFSIVDRGELWYNTLTNEQYSELKRWRQDWLDVTITKKIPIAPAWINDKLEGDDIL